MSPLDDTLESKVDVRFASGVEGEVGNQIEGVVEVCVVVLTYGVEWYVNRLG